MGIKKAHIRKCEHLTLCPRELIYVSTVTCKRYKGREIFWNCKYQIRFFCFKLDLILDFAYFCSCYEENLENISAMA